MPKLSSDVASKVEEAEGGNFEPIPENVYLAALDGEVTQENGANGPYWKWIFRIVGGEYDGRKLFTNTSLSEKAHWKLKEVFAAFGVPTDTDTDDLIGRHVKLMVVQRLIEQGTRKGDMGNDVKQVLPADADAAAAAKTKTGSKKGGAKPAEDVLLF